jgi:5S rRNA maturation endonuclease (ribonuclease M5)
MREVATYQYTDPDGVLLYEVVRFEPKAFRQRRADGEWTLNGVSRVLYRLPEVLAVAAHGETVIVVEGEKDVETLRSRGLVATCNSGGAGQWRAEFAQALRGADVVIVPDGDEQGERHAAQVAATLRAPRVLRLGAKDVSEWFANGGTVEVFAELVRDAPLWKPVLKGEGNTLNEWGSQSRLASSRLAGDCPFTWAEALRDGRTTVARWSPEESYAYVAMQRAQKRVAGAPRGQRDWMMRREALGLGNQVGAGRLGVAHAVFAVWQGAVANGLVREEGAARVQAIILRALWRGMQEPAGLLRRQHDSLRPSFHVLPSHSSEI